MISPPVFDHYLILILIKSVLLGEMLQINQEQETQNPRCFAWTYMCLMSLPQVVREVLLDVLDEAV